MRRMMILVAMIVVEMSILFSEEIQNLEKMPNIISRFEKEFTEKNCIKLENHLILVVKSVKDYHGYVPIMVAIDDGEKIIRDGEFEDCDPKDVVRISEKIKKALTKLN